MFIEGNPSAMAGNNNNNFNYFRVVTHSAVLVYKGPSIYKQTNLTKWRCIKVKIQMFITSGNPKQGKGSLRSLLVFLRARGEQIELRVNRIFKDNGARSFRDLYVMTATS